MKVAVVESDDIDEMTRMALGALWERAFGDRFSEDDVGHAYGDVHVLARAGDDVVGHASVVPRRLRFGDQPWLTIGYVEAVATDPAHQGDGIGRRLMMRLHGEIRARWPAALLSTGRTTVFYERLGWERWQGLSHTRTAAGVFADRQHGGLTRRPCVER